jgi:F-type H+-transporting ATPase subunit b
MDILQSLGIDWKLLLAQIINFLVILFLLKKFAYKPFLKKNIIKQGIKKSEKAEKMLQTIKVQRDKILTNAQKKAQQLFKQNEKRGEEKAIQIIECAHKEKEGILATAVQQGKMEAEKMQKDHKQGMLHLSLGLTEKILRQKIDYKKDEQIINEFLLHQMNFYCIFARLARKFLTKDKCSIVIPVATGIQTYKFIFWIPNQVGNDNY